MHPNKNVERFAIGFTKWIGSPASIIAHTIAFIASFALSILGMVEWNTMLLVLTTIVSLEAIYLAIFIQMTINYTTQDIVEIQEDIDEIQEDVEEISEDVEEISEDVDEMHEDIEEISEDVGELNEEDETEEAAEARHKQEQAHALEAIKSDLQKLLADVERLKER